MFFQFIFVSIPILLLLGALWLLQSVGLVRSMWDPSVFGPLFVLVGLVAWLGYYLVLDRMRPKSDFDRIKLRLGQNGDTVLSVIPFGVKLGTRNDYSTYRIYRAHVREKAGNEVNHTLCVVPTLFGGGAILDQRHQERTLTDLGSGAAPEPYPTAGPGPSSWKGLD